MPLKLHRRLASHLGYDLQKFNKQLLLETHLSSLLPLLEIDLVIDVGANQGQFARMLRDEVGYVGTIHSFEPLPDAYLALQIASHLDAGWHVHNVVLGDCDSTLKRNGSHHSKFSSVHDVNARSGAKFRKGIAVARSASAPVRRLDSLLEELVPDILDRRAYLKMDTQGHDKWVFEGLGNLARRFMGLQSALSVMGIEGVPDYVEMLDLYRSNGFELTGAYTVNRCRETGYIVQMDCVFASLKQ